ncbi:MAG TPA: 3-isopropylmalate dehydratase large subunit [Pseudolysinimonas sp.]|nr:3-isopropylmalate dehydratase large subunit [Pseudolysinimonas sp.]
MGDTLLQKVWDLHTVRQLPTGQTQLFIGLHLVHEVTSPQAFDTLRANGWTVPFLDRTFATVDHIVPTLQRRRPFLDVMAEDMMASLERNVRDFGVRFVGLDDIRQGIVHVIGPELGLTQPGMTIACGDSHTSTHGAFGSVAFGIGTSQVRDVLASQCLALEPLKVRRIRVTGTLPKGVYAKDVILTIIQRLGVQGGNGYAYEYAGDAVDRMSMDERMTICNMSIEGGARVGYVNPDDTTVDYVRGRPFAPAPGEFDRMAAWWKSMASDANAAYDDDVEIKAAELTPIVTWGVNPGQSIGVDDKVPEPERASDPKAVSDALGYMGLTPGQPIEGMKVDVAFIGSCTNSRLSDLREAARIVKGKHIAPHVKGLVVPGSSTIAKVAEDEGLADVFREAGFEWRGAGCSMCLGMNPDKLEGNQVCASSSNRNFKGRQGSPTGRTLLMSPAMVAAAAVAGEVTDVRELL